MESIEPKEKRLFKSLFRYLGPGFLVTVGFIDPGNWATNIAGGAKFGYDLLWVITLSTLILIVIQNMAARLGIATGKSLAVNIKNHFSNPISIIIGTTIVTACGATDVAELLGGAIGVKLLFGCPLWIGALVIVVLEVFFIVTQRYHKLEKIILIFLATISICYIIEIFIVKPNFSTVAAAFIIPKINNKNIYIALGMLGAVVMPHNIFLHSNVIHSRKWGKTEEKKKSLTIFEKIDTSTAMLLGWAINSAMIIVAVSVFFKNGVIVNSLQQASLTLTPLAGRLAGVLFAIALLFAGISSSITSSMAEVNVITGFLGKPEDPSTTLYKVAAFITAIPSFLIILSGISTFKILILSQVVLSLQLPFTLLPLLILCRRKSVMGKLRSKTTEFVLAIVISVAITLLNIYLLYTTIW